MWKCQPFGCHVTVGRAVNVFAGFSLSSRFSLLEEDLLIYIAHFLVVLFGVFDGI